MEIKNRRIENAGYRKWLEDDETTIKFFGYSMNGWRNVTPATARRFSIEVDADHRLLAVHCGMKYYSQKLIQLYRSSGLHRWDFQPEYLSDFLTEIGRNNRLLIALMAPMDGSTQFQLRHRFFGIPTFHVSCEITSFMNTKINQGPWTRNDLINAASPLFAQGNFLRIELGLGSAIFPDEGTKKRVGIESVPPLIFATFDLAKQDRTLRYCYTSDYVSENIAFRFMQIDRALASRHDRHQDRFPGRLYTSRLHPLSDILSGN